MANPLPDEIKVKIAEYVAKRPFRKDQFLDKFKQRGYDVSEFEDPTNTIQDNIAAFTAGIPEGATYGLVDLEEYGKDAGTVDLPLLGEVQPAREAGRLLGGMATGGALFKTGMRVGVPTGKRVVDSLLKRGITGKTAGVVGKVSEIATASTPEAVLGSLAHTYRADDLSELDNSFAEWMALGIGSEILGRKVMKYLARRKVPGVGSTDNILEEGNAVREEVKTELENQMDLDAPDGGAQEILSNTDAYGESLVPGVPPDFDQMPMDVRAMNDPDRTTMALTDAESVKQMESMNDSAVLRHDKESGRVDDIVLPDSNVISPKMGWSFGGQGKSFPVEEFTAIKSNTGLGEWDGEIYFNNKRSLKDNIVGTVRVTAGKDPKKVVFVDEKNLKSLYDNPDSYKHSQGGVYGVSGGFDTIDDLRDFVIAHEIEHFRHPYLTWKNWYGGSKDVKKKALAAEESGITNYEVDTSKAAYENWVNKLALDTRAKAKEKGKRIAVTDKPENPTETPRFEEGNRNHNNFSEKTDAKLGIKRSNDLQQQSEFSPNDMGESGRAISPSGKQTIEGTVIDTAEDAVMIRNDKTGKDRWYRVSKGWKISVSGRPIQEAAESIEPSNFPFTSASTAPTQVGGAGPATAEQREKLAGLINAIRKDDTQNEMHSLEFLPDNITVASANEHIDRLMEDLITVKTRRNSRAINDIDRMAEAGNSRRFGNDPVQNPPLQEYADALIPEDVQRKARGPLHTLFRKFWVPTSKVLGFGSHPMSAMAIRNTVRLTVEKQSLEGKWMDYAVEVVKQPDGTEKKVLGTTLQNIEELITGVPRNASVLDQISGKVQRDIKSEDQKKLFYDFFNVVEDMNNGAPRATAIKAYPSMAKNPNINEAIDMHLRLTNSIADDLGLGKNKRISYYIPHIFSDRSGEYVAASVSNTMDNASNRKLKSMMEDFGADAPIESPEAPSRGFRHLRKREANLDHFEHDYQQVMSMYIRGASAKITNDKIAQHGRSAMLKLVSEGNQDIAEDLSKYLRYAMGMPTDFRQKVAHVFSDSHVFNSTVDRLVGFIGGKDAAILQRARLNPNDSELMFESRKWMNELDDMTRLRDRVTGDKKEKAALKKIRGVLAKRIDDTRNAANNPYMAASTSNFLYRTQIVAKLGFNIAHGMINQTQILTNVLAMLKAKNVAWGYAHTVFGVGKDKTFNGRNISDLIAESGISRDVGRQQEFLDGPAGALKYAQDKSMFIAKYSEEVNRETTLLAAYKEHVEMGDGHGASLHKARELVEETHFSFSRAGTAPILRSPVGRLFLMFKSYPMHQTDFTLGLVAKALTKGPDGKRLRNSDDYAPLVKHAIAYATLIGGGAYALPGTNIGDRTTPPAYDIPADMVKDSGRYGLPGSVVKNLMGPFGDTMTKVTGMMTSLIDGGMEQANHKALRAAQSFALPSTVRRLYGEEIDAGNLLKGKKYDWLYFTGLKKYDPDENKKSRATGGISPLQSLGLGN